MTTVVVFLVSLLLLGGFWLAAVAVGVRLSWIKPAHKRKALVLFPVLVMLWAGVSLSLRLWTVHGVEQAIAALPHARSISIKGRLVNYNDAYGPVRQPIEVNATLTNQLDIAAIAEIMRRSAPRLNREETVLRSVADVRCGCVSPGWIEIESDVFGGKLALNFISNSTAIAADGITTFSVDSPVAFELYRLLHERASSK